MAVYSIKRNRLKSAYKEGFELSEENVLVSGQDSLFRVVILKGIDGMDNDAYWGRLKFDIKLEGEAYYNVYAAAVNYKQNGDEPDIDTIFEDKSIPANDKILFFQRLDAKRVAGKNDILLYDISGRYLYIAIEVSGQGSAEIKNMFVDSVGDNFMDTFPEVYRERNSFFHRYMSVYSSVYNDFRRDIERLPELLDLDTCPEELLLTYGSWMGLDLAGGFLSGDVLRNLVKEAYELNKMKGTKKAIKRIIEIMIGKEATVIEHNSIRASLKEEGDEGAPPGFTVRGIYDVTVLVDVKLTEELRHQLFYVLNQFKPVRTKIDIVKIDESVIMDSSSFLDVNAKVPETREGRLDEEAVLDGVITLS